jgi:hypothetical protein
MANIFGVVKECEFKELAIFACELALGVYRVAGFFKELAGGVRSIRV